MEEMKKLMKRKEEIESEISSALQVLESQSGVGMDQALVDAEGFPRDDIDVYSVRHARQRVIYLRNDHKALMKEIESQLVLIHNEARDKGGLLHPTPSSSSSSSISMETSEVVLPRHFARVAQVSPDSPADIAGLRPNDLLLRFGSVATDNFVKLADVASVVSHGKDSIVAVTVVREGRVIDLKLTPRVWAGRGLLGCNILPATCGEARIN